MSDDPIFEPSDFRNQTDFLLNLLERSQFSYVEALKLGGWPIDVILAAYECDGDKNSKIYRACMTRATQLSEKEKVQNDLVAFVDWVWFTVKCAIDANLGPRRTDKITKECYDDFIDTMTTSDFISYDTLNDMYGHNKEKQTRLWVMKQTQAFLKEHPADGLKAFRLSIEATDEHGEPLEWSEEIG